MFCRFLVKERLREDNPASLVPFPAWGKDCPNRLSSDIVAL